MSNTQPNGTLFGYHCMGATLIATYHGDDGVLREVTLDTKSVQCGYDEKFSQAMKLFTQTPCEVQSTTCDPVIFPQKGVDNPEHFLHYQYQSMVNRIMYLVFFVFMPVVWYFMFRDEVTKAGAITYTAIVGMLGVTGLFHIRWIFIDIASTIWDDYLDYLKGR